MTPELVQSGALFVYSLLFLGVALILWRKKRVRLHALTNHRPCAAYLKMRLETAKLFDTKEYSLRKFQSLTYDISGIIKDELESQGLPTHRQNIRAKKQNLKTEIGKIHQTLADKCLENTDRPTKIRRAMVFEANERLMSHPYDLIGQRRLKLFADSLASYLNPDDNGAGQKTREGIMRGKISQWLNSTKTDMFVVIKIVAVLGVVTLLVNGNDYFQDVSVIIKFWTIGYKGHILDKDTLSQVLLLKFYPPAMFLTLVIFFSTIQIVLHMPSLGYRYKVSMQMASTRPELGLESIDPFHVVNQYNLPRSESGNEAIWQMMVQWGVYFCFSWFVTWRLKLKDKDDDELHEVNNLLSFSTLFWSMISSIGSLTYGQYVAHAICYKNRTSFKEKILYFVSAGLSTVCNTCILVCWQTAITDFGIGDSIYQTSTFGFLDPAILIIAFLLITPFLYRYMVLPTSNSLFRIISMNTPCFFHGMMIQCLVFSFFLGITAVTNSYLYDWGPQLVPSLPEIAANVSGNDSYLSIDAAEYTPANAYQGHPINNRLLGIIFSLLAIPVTWAGSYTGLYLYFRSVGTGIQFQPSVKDNQHSELSWRALKQVIVKRMKSFVNEEPSVDGRWMDLNYTSDEMDLTNQSSVSSFLDGTSQEDKTKLDHIKSSFCCWVTDKEATVSPLEWITEIGIFISILVFLYTVTLVIGYVIGQAHEISSLF